MNKKISEYTIKDDLFFRVLSSFAEEFEKQNVPYTLIGGGAVQARIASMLSNDGKGRIEDIDGLELLIRKTGDLEFALNVEDMKLPELINTYCATNGTSVQPITSDSKSLRVSNENGYINVNLETNPKDFRGLPEFYYDIIKTSQQVELRKGNKRISVCTTIPEYIVASKLTRFAEKDKIDSHNLIKCMYQKGKKFDYEWVRNVLKQSGKDENYGYLINIKSEIEK